MSSTASGGGIVRNRTKQQAKQRQTGRRRPTRRPVRAGHLGPSGLPLLRTSERGTFKRCQWKWWLEFHELAKPKVDVPPLRFGGLIHEALGLYYKPGIRRGPHPARTFEIIYERDLTTAAGETKNYSKPEIDQIWSEHRDLGLDMLNGYINQYGADDEWRVIVTEHPFRAIVNHPVRNTPWFWYVGILDGLWENRSTKRRVIPEHKTTKAINLVGLQLDDQATAYYTWGFDALINARLIGPKEKLDGILFNFLRKAKDPVADVDPEGFVRNKPKKQHYVEAFKRSRGFNPKWKLEQMEAYAKRRKIVVHGDISKRQPTPRFMRVPVYREWYERESARLRVLAEYENIERLRRDSNGPGSHRIPPVTAMKAADKMICAGCWALDICELHEIGQDWRELAASTTRNWDPYAAHEIKEGR